MMNDPIIKVIKSNKPGPSITIIAGIHGNEVSSIKSVQKLINYPPLIQKGKLTLILANPKAIFRNKRFIEEDLNRCFLKDKTRTGSYEEELAEYLKKYLQDQDICIDLHCSNVPQTETFVICERNASRLLKYIDTNKIIFGFDVYEPGGTDYYMNLNRKIGVCIELGALNNNKATKKGIEIVYNILSSQEMIDKEIKIYQRQSVFNISRYFIPSGNFIIKKEFEDFETIKKGQIIGIDDNKEITNQINRRIIFARSVDNREYPIKRGFIVINNIR